MLSPDFVGRSHSTGRVVLIWTSWASAPTAAEATRESVTRRLRIFGKLNWVEAVSRLSTGELELVHVDEEAVGFVVVLGKLENVMGLDQVNDSWLNGSKAVRDRKVTN
jgi:hypothetical protein